MENQKRSVCSSCGKILKLRTCDGEYFDLSAISSIGSGCICLKCGAGLKNPEGDGERCTISVCASCGQPLLEAASDDKP
ncbi:MAG: hypothetical protein WC473_05375 [Patescibacteria group bacterium]|jgi:predicted amidophosphoribosyltransferase